VATIPPKNLFETKNYFISKIELTSAQQHRYLPKFENSILHTNATQMMQLA